MCVCDVCVMCGIGIVVEMLEEMLYLTNQPNMKINILASQEQGSNTRHVPQYLSLSIVTDSIPH